MGLYLKENRLSHVLAAIQVMATHRNYKQTVAEWADLIFGDKNRCHDLEIILSEHKEFFRASVNDNSRYSLVMRRSMLKNLDPNTGRNLNRSELYQLTNAERLELKRPPLTESQISKLMEFASLLHQKEVEAHKDRRWWLLALVPMATSAVGAGLGVLLGNTASKK